MTRTTLAVLSTVIVAGSMRAEPTRDRHARSIKGGAALAVTPDAAGTELRRLVADSEATPDLVPSLLGPPRPGSAGTIELTLVLRNASDSVAYWPSVTCRCAGATAPLLRHAFSEGGTGLLPGQSSLPATLTLPQRACGTPEATILVVPRAMPRLLAVIGGYGTDPGRFSKPRGAELDARGRLVVADRGNNRVQVVRTDGRVVATWGRFGHAPGEFDHPEDVSL